MADVGRPTIMTEAVVQKLLHAFSLGCTDAEACLYAGCDKRTLYHYQNGHPEFVTRKELLKKNPVLLARTTVAEALKTDTNVARWYLERKKSDEFGAKQVIEVTHKVDDKQLIDSLRQLMIESSTSGTTDVIDAEYSTTEPDNLIDHVSP